jgi:hypothetical protein
VNALASPFERLARLGISLRDVLEQLPPAPTVDELVANSQRIVVTAYGEQDGNGVDLTLIRRNLRLSPTARIRQADAARHALQQLSSRVQRSG